MRPETIKLVKTSWAKVRPVSEAAADLFYGKLFELDPQLRPLFKGDIRQQGENLMAMLNTAVISLENLPALVPALQAMGKRHVAYGVKDADYDTVGAALIWTLNASLQDAFTSEVKAAWIDAYTLVADTLKSAATE